METNYEIKHKPVLMPLKLLLLVIAMAMFSVYTFAQEGKTISVANNQQLIEALDNPMVRTIELQSGYYEAINLQVTQGTKVVKGGERNNPDANCIYTIMPMDQCYDPVPPETFVTDTATAGTIGGSLICPPDDAGTWTIISKPAGSTLTFLDLVTEDTIPFKVNQPGSYLLRYTWPAPFNTHVQTEYFFYDEAALTLSAENVCGLETTVHFTISHVLQDPNETIVWHLNNSIYPGPTTSSNFELIVDTCGTYVLSVIVTPTKCPPDTATIIIKFFCEPDAEAGPDIQVCNDLCYYSLIGASGIFPPTGDLQVTWSQISGPDSYQLTFNNPDGDTTGVCREAGVCSYGRYEVEFSVVNGLCEDADTMFIDFFEQPVAEAGPDQFLCGETCFSLGAIPFPYCSDPIGDERYAKWVKAWGPGNITFTDSSLFNTGVCVSVIDPDTANCLYGTYYFVWSEQNGTCSSQDITSVTIYEQPIADAGADQFICEDNCFTITAIPFEYCSKPLDNERVSKWIAAWGPDGISILINDSTLASTHVCVTELIKDGINCYYGQYYFVWYEQSGTCVSYDTTVVTIYEQPTADAGVDFDVACGDMCFSMNAIPFLYCSDPIGNERYGEWTKTEGPAGVTFDDTHDAKTTACIDTAGVACPYGDYEFVWTEYNGTCTASDTVVASVFEPPIAVGGDDASYCLNADFSLRLEHMFSTTAYEYCQQVGLQNYHYWTKCGGPGVVTFYNDSTPNASVLVSAFGCYCFVWHEVNGNCESTDTVHVCWYEHPYLSIQTSEFELCDTLCIDLSQAGIVEYQYLPLPNVNYDNTYWTVVEKPAGAVTTFTNQTDSAVFCSDKYGEYQLIFTQRNDQGVVPYLPMCGDSVMVEVEFFEQPTANAGEDVEICGNCAQLMAIPFSYTQPNDVDENFAQYWEYLYNGKCQPLFTMNDPNTFVCLPEGNTDAGDPCGTCYGDYSFVWHEINGTCQSTDTVTISFGKMPDPGLLCGQCYQGGPIGPPNRGDGQYECHLVNDTIVVCAFECCNFSYYPACDPYTFGNDGRYWDWSVIGPAGTTFDPFPGYWDADGNFHWPSINVCWGECCDTGYIYVTEHTPLCDTTFEWVFIINQAPAPMIVGPEIAEVTTDDITFSYCAIIDPETIHPMDTTCWLYEWNVQPCGEIVSGQGTSCINVHWFAMGWGTVELVVFDTCTGCSGRDTLAVHVLPQYSLGDCALSGYVNYHNASGTPLDGVHITLWNGTVPIFDTWSFNDIDGGNGQGYYEFPGINCTNNFGLTADYNAPWWMPGPLPGANATDALAIQLFTIGGLPLGFHWAALENKAADVNLSSTINATDALWVKQRAINMVNHFPAGDWAFGDDVNVLMNTTAGTFNILALTYGDVNRSNIPATTKDMPAVDLINDGVISVVPGEVFELPIRVAQPVTLGAITLNLGYNTSLLDVIDVTSADGMVNNVDGNSIYIAWSSVNPMTLNDNDAVVTLRMKAKGEIVGGEELLTVNFGTEFADPNANVIQGMTLKTFGITTAPAPDSYFLSDCRPNPFSGTTQIDYTLPEKGKVRLSVIDMLGQEIAVLVESTQTAGSYTITYGAPGMTPGVYMYKIVVQGETKNFVESRRMIVSH